MTTKYCLEIGAAVTAFLAAFFWFLSAYGKLPPILTYWYKTPEHDPFYLAVKSSAVMNRWAAGFSGASALCMGIGLLMAPADAEVLLQIDYGWRTDGKIACTQEYMQNGPSRRYACVDPIGDLENFAQEMDTQFASDLHCRGITFVRFPWGPLKVERATALLKQPHWMFFIVGYGPGDASQVWKLLDPTQRSVFRGQGDPQEIVGKVCSVVGGAGGTPAR